MPGDCALGAWPVLRPLGDTGLSVELGAGTDPDLIRRVHAFDAAFAALGLPGVVETVPTYRAVLIHLDPLRADVDAIARAAERLAAAPAEGTAAGRLLSVPVAYGGRFGCDLDAVAGHAGMRPADLIEAHAAAEYLVAMIGFLPGFCYLAGLDPRLAMPRRPEPRPRIPASSISIGGVQTAIGSVEGPSGWHLIGRSPARPYVETRAPRFLFGPGDRIRFRPVSEPEWEALDKAAAAGAPVIEVLAP